MRAQACRGMVFGLGTWHLRTRQVPRNTKQWHYEWAQISQCSTDAASKVTKILSSRSPCDNFIAIVKYMARSISYSVTPQQFFKTVTYLSGDQCMTNPTWWPLKEETIRMKNTGISIVGSRAADLAAVKSSFKSYLDGDLEDGSWRDYPSRRLDRMGCKLCSINFVLRGVLECWPWCCYC